jgi:thiamine monophosphate kinase
MPSEFDLISRYFARPTPQAVLGPGDDCALLAPSPGMELAITTDMLVAGTHFFPDTDPYQLGWKTLAVNLSDLAAMGAKPRWVLLAGSLPEADEEWLATFADGLFACAKRYGVDLVGGDTTRGPLNLCLTALGEVPAGVPCAAMARPPATTSGYPDSPAWRRWAWRTCKSKSCCPRRYKRAALPPCNDRCRALNSDWPCKMARWRIRPSTSPTACWPTSAISPNVRHRCRSLRSAASLHACWRRCRRGASGQLAGGDDYELVFSAAPEKRQKSPNSPPA